MITVLLYRITMRLRSSYERSKCISISNLFKRVDLNWRNFNFGFRVRGSIIRITINLIRLKYEYEALWLSP